MTEVNKNILKDIYRKRPENAKKYDYGLLLVIGGSEFYSGAPALSALAAFRAGVDMVRIIAPKRAADIIASFGPDMAAYPLEGIRLANEHLPILISMTESAKASAHGKTAVVIGGGIGRSEETQNTILEYLSQTVVPTVIDADGIYALGKNPKVISIKPSLITPHGYEFFILTGREVANLPNEERIKIVQEEAARLKTTILLKGETDIISNGGNTALVKAGSPLMTVGGTGDTLAGIAGALMARGISPFESGQAAALINGLAGAKAGEELGESMMATDLIEAIPEILPKN
jgi:NAD(P)H-hydrate epimerase